MPRIAQILIAAVVGLSFASVSGCAEQPAPKRDNKKKKDKKEAEKKTGDAANDAAGNKSGNKSDDKAGE